MVAAVVIVCTACSTTTTEPAAPVTTEQPPPAADQVQPATAADPLAVDDVDEATRERVVADLTAAVANLQAQPVEISFEMTEDGEPRSGLVRVDRSARLLEGVFLSPLPGGSVVTTRHVVVEDRAFLKSTTGAEAEAALDYTEFPVDPIGADLLDEVFAGYARVETSLDRIIHLLENVPFAAEVTAPGNGTEISVIMSPRSIAEYYSATGLEAVGGAIPSERTRLAFRIEDGVLRAVVADGTHFHDGEALSVAASILYTPIEPFTLEIPPLEQ